MIGGDRRSEGDARLARVQCTATSMARRPRSISDDEPASSTSGGAPTAGARTSGANEHVGAKRVDLRGQALAPDLETIRRFILDSIARGAIAELVAAVLALLQRMREINTELMARVATKSRKRPPNETLRRLQLELPLMFAAAANDAAAPDLEGPPEPPPTKEEQEEKKKKERNKNRHPHGRPTLPAGLERVDGSVSLVADDKRMCPRCKRPTKTVGFKTTEKLTIEPCKYVVEQNKVETCACGSCHEYIVTADKPDEVVDRRGVANGEPPARSARRLWG